MAAPHCRNFVNTRPYIGLLAGPHSFVPKLHSNARRKVFKCLAFTPKTAEEAVETGLSVLTDKKDADEALRLFQEAMKLNPDEAEARAAVYNSACCYAKMEKWSEAAEAVKEAVNERGLRMKVAMEDDDLAELRDQRVWKEMMGDVSGGMSQDMLVDLKSEAKSPFRFPRIWILGSLTAAAALNLFVTLPKLILALQGGDNAPDLAETSQLAGLNSVLLFGLVFVLVRDLQQKEKDKVVIGREEALSELMVETSTKKIIPVKRLRGSVRPVIIFGNRAHIRRSLKAAKPDYLELRDRGVSVVPVVVSDEDPGAKIRALKKEFSESSGGFGSTEAEAEAGEAQEEKITDKKWRIEPYEASEWMAWIKEQKEFSGVDTESGYIQVQLDGSVRSSGSGMPPWKAFVSDIPPLDSLRTRLTDNIGT